MTEKSYQSEPVSYPKASLLMRLDDALALYDEPIWRELKQALMQPKAKEAPKEWYNANPERLIKEKTILSRLLLAAPECPSLFFRQEHTGRLGAIGLVELSNRERAKVELIFPDDFPASPPQVFFFRSSLNLSGRSAAEDRRIAVAMDMRPRWNEKIYCDTVLTWASDWLIKTFNFVRPGTASNNRRPRS